VAGDWPGDLLPLRAETQHAGGAVGGSVGVVSMQRRPLPQGRGSELLRVSAGWVRIRLNMARWDVRTRWRKVLSPRYGAFRRFPRVQEGRPVQADGVSHDRDGHASQRAGPMSPGHWSMRKLSAETGADCRVFSEWVRIRFNMARWGRRNPLAKSSVAPFRGFSAWKI